MQEGAALDKRAAARYNKANEKTEGNDMEAIKRITSFTVDHTKLLPGIYISRVDGDVVTYDLRTRTPNAGDYMDNGTMHTVEHMMATFLRNSAIAEKIIYFGPMGCQTGFYLLVRDCPKETVLAETKEALRKTVAYDGPVFGGSERECGNYKTLDLALAKKECARYLAVLEAKEQTFLYD